MTDFSILNKDFYYYYWFSYSLAVSGRELCLSSCLKSDMSSFLKGFLCLTLNRLSIKWLCQQLAIPHLLTITNLFPFDSRWQRVVLSWSLSDGLWLYTDSQFRGWTKTPKSVPRDVVTESGDFIVGRKNVGPDFSPAEFSIGSLAVFPRFLEKKDVEKLFSGKS